MESKITLIGMENYLQSQNDSLFKNLTLPPGIDKETFIDNLLLTHGEFETLYADADYMQLFTTTWSKKWYRTFERWVNAINTDYDPLENYDRYEDVSETGVQTHTGTIGFDKSGQDDNTQTYNNLTDTIDGTVTETPTDWTETTTPGVTDTVETEVTTENVKTTTERQVSAFDSNSYSNQEKVTVEVEPVTGAEGSTTVSTSHTGSDTVTKSGTYATDTDSTNVRTGSVSNVMNYGTQETTTNNLVDDSSLSRIAHLHGNIGVTTSQQMLQSELEVQRFNLINEITNLYAVELLVLVY